MARNITSIRRSLALAGAAALSAGSFGFTLDAQILIERALNSPNLTVKYDGANAKLIELRVNGESISTKALVDTNNKGEASFLLSVTDLKDGENEVEIRLYDRTGKVISSQKQSIFTDEANRGPVYLTGPKQGASVQGPVEIKVGFGKELRNTFVSFFVDGDHKAITNVRPYNYVWDTTREANGWHTVEAWVVDETTNTYKTKPVRVFVNNPGGRTNRHGIGQSDDSKVTKSNKQPSLSETANPGSGSAPKVGAVLGTATAAAASANAISPGSTKAVVTTIKAATNSSPSSTKELKATKAESIKVTPPIAMGSQDMTPTGLRMAKITGTTSPDVSMSAAKRVLSVEKGTRLEGVSTFNVSMNGSFVEFDVAPRVDNGVPMTPFRHLIEKAGGDVKWMNDAKVVSASADGRTIVLKIGDKQAFINNLANNLEIAPYIDRGRTIVPLSFIKDALNVQISFDPATGHVLIQKK